MKSIDVIPALKSVPAITGIVGQYIFSKPPIRSPESAYLYCGFVGRERTQVTNADTLRVTILSKNIDELEILEDVLIDSFERNFISGNYQSIFLSSNPSPLKLDNGFYATILRFKVWQTI